MRIVDPQHDANFDRRCKQELQELARQPDDREQRPCAVCTLPCSCSGSPSCACDCSSACPHILSALSSEPDYPIEPGIGELVYALTCLRLVQPCWSCEGHTGNTASFQKPPRVWFRAQSSMYPDLIATYLSECAANKSLSTPWQVCVVALGESAVPTYSIEPRFKGDPPSVDKLQQDVKIIAKNLQQRIKVLASQRAEIYAATT